MPHFRPTRQGSDQLMPYFRFTRQGSDQLMPYFRPGSARQPGYEDFEPKCESKDEPNSHLLLIHLPDFRREQISFICESGLRRARVFGKRQVGVDNQWSRFNIFYPVPESCDTRKIQLKFEEGILTITMPKVIPGDAPKEEPKPTEQAKPPQPATQPTAEKTQEVVPPKAEEMAQKSQEDTSKEPKSEFDSKKQDAKKVETSILSKTKSESLSENGQEGTFQEPRLAFDNKNQLADEKKVETVVPPKEASDSMPLKGQEGIPQKDAFSTEAKIQAEAKGATAMPSSENDEKQQVEKKDSREDNGKPFESGKPTEKADGSFTENQSKEGSKESSMVAEMYVGKISEKEKAKDKKETSRESDGNVDEENHRKDTKNSKVKGIKEVAASASQAMTRVAKRFNEDDKQMMIYIGAAAVVAIAALGVYASDMYCVGRS